MSKHSEQIRIRGQVQGVGFRPMVWQLARSLGIHGEVRNDAEGVTIIAQAQPQQISRFIEDINNNQPPLASIRDIDRQRITAAQTFRQFSIETSRRGPVETSVVADAATCDSCLKEINDPQDRRYRHAFANCTHCGPRISITRAIPYDRANTSMASFAMCDNCKAEYHDPANRRFHAQPICCPDCGPQLELWSSTGEKMETADCIEQAAGLLLQGAIIAIKGIGGFQLACLASDDNAVAVLRERKNRPHKPLAMMAASLAQISQYCDPDSNEAEILQSSAAPVVLLKTTNHGDLSPRIAPAQGHLGFMLPNSPLHHLLMQSLPGPIVLTSGNTSNEPQAINNEQALKKLGPIADYWLLHDRDIINRIDDSVLRVSSGHKQTLRRARGYAPQPLPLPRSLQQAPVVLACGAQMKNTFALARGDEVILSQHIGNLENPLACSDYEHNVRVFELLFDCQPGVVAVDLHPDYQSSRFGRQYANHRDIPVIEVQHHHAHIAACLADNRWPVGEKVIGIALDGLGLGNDGQFWGGEFLLADYREFARLASLQPFPLAGGDRASRQPWRNTLAQLKTVGLWEEAQDLLQTLPQWQLLDKQALQALGEVINSGKRFPMTSSCGRLFDAVAGILGICAAGTSYDGQAASELETRQLGLDLAAVKAYPFDCSNDELPGIDTRPMWQALLEDLRNRENPQIISARFHAGLASIIVSTASKLASQQGVGTVALSGGVFQNQSLLRHMLTLFTASELTVLQHQSTPCNDGGIALGQAAICRALNLEKP